jgi:hypothetical protein
MAAQWWGGVDGTKGLGDGDKKSGAGHGETSRAVRSKNAGSKILATRVQLRILPLRALRPASSLILHFDLLFLGWLLMGPALCWAGVTLSVLLCTINGRELPYFSKIQNI